MAYRNYSTAVSHIVDTTGQGDFTTIAAALTAAVSGQTIFIRPGTYTENPTLVAGVDLVSFPGEGNTGNVIIKGNCTLSTAGTVTISGVQLQTNSAAIITVSGSSASILNVVGCNLNMATTAVVFSAANASAQINLYQCIGNISAGSVTPFNMSSTGTLTVIGCNITNTGGSTTSTTMSAGSAVFQNNNFQFAVTNSSTGGLTSAYNYYNTAAINTASATIGGSGTNKFSSDVFLAGTASAISVGGTATFTSCQFSSSNTNAITGAGTLTTIGCQFTGSSHLNNATTTTGSGAGSGLTNGVAPAAGQIGELISSYIASASAVSLSTGSAKTVTSISLTPGVWDLSVFAQFNIAGTTTVASIFSGASATNNTLLNNYGQDTAYFIANNNVGFSPSLVVPKFRVLLAATTTYYYVAQATFGVSTLTAFGGIFATRAG